MKKCSHLEESTKYCVSVYFHLYVNNRKGSTRLKPDDKCKPKTCFLCNHKSVVSGELHTVETLALDTKLTSMATDLRDPDILPKLAPGDMTVTDAVYHKQCLTAFYGFMRKMTRNRRSHNEHYYHKATSFAELITYIESYARESMMGQNHIFKLSEI